MAWTTIPCRTRSYVACTINMKHTGNTVHEFTGSIADDPHSIYFRKENTWVTQRVSGINVVKYHTLAIRNE